MGKRGKWLLVLAAVSAMSLVAAAGLAAGLADLRSHEDQITGGLVALPVTW